MSSTLIGQFKLLPSQNNNFLNIAIINEDASKNKKICEKIFGDLNDFEALINLINKYCCIHEKNDLSIDEDRYIFADDKFVYIFITQTDEYMHTYFRSLRAISIRELKELASSTCIKLAKVLIQEYDLADKRYIYQIISQTSNNASKILHEYFGKDGNNQCEMLMDIVLNYLPFSTEFKPGFYNVYLTNYNSEDKWFRIAPAQYHTHFNPGHFDPKIKISINSILEKYKNDLGNSKRETISLEDACQNSLLEATEKINIMVDDAKNKLDMRFNEIMNKKSNKATEEKDIKYIYLCTMNVLDSTLYGSNYDKCYTLMRYCSDDITLLDFLKVLSHIATKGCYREMFSNKDRITFEIDNHNINISASINDDEPFKSISVAELKEAVLDYIKKTTLITPEVLAKSENDAIEKIKNIAERSGDFYQTVARPAPITIRKENPEVAWGKQIFVIKKSGEIDTGIITDVNWYNDKLQIILSSTHKYAYGKLSDMGVKWFLTKGEAEAKLKTRTEIINNQIECIVRYKTRNRFTLKFAFYIGLRIFILNSESNELLATRVSGITGFENKSTSGGTITYTDNNGEPHSIDIMEYDTRLFIDLSSALIAYSEATGSPASSLAIIHVD